MLKHVLFIFLFGVLSLAETNPQVIILSSHKVKKKAKLDVARLEKDFAFFSGYPKLVDSKSVGLPAGTWVWIAGYCRSDETINFVNDRNKQTSVALPLDEQKYLLKSLKAVVKKPYAKATKTTENSCPIVRMKSEVIYITKAGPSDTGIRWQKKPFSFPELSRFAIYLSPERQEASNYLASYGYKYMQKDETLLQIIYNNNYVN